MKARFSSDRCGWSQSCRLEGEGGLLQGIRPVLDAVRAGDRFFGYGRGVGTRRHGLCRRRPSVRQEPVRPLGAYAEFTTTKPALIARKPASLDHIQAAAIPTASLAAWQSLFGEKGIGLQAGQTILIHGAAGGVGSFAVQLAKWRGARVLGTASAKNEAYLRDLGVDQVIDYTKQPFDAVVHDIDAVFDTIGGDVETRSWSVLKPGGVLASIVAQKLTPPKDAPPGVRGVTNSSLPDSKLREIAGLVDAGTLKLTVSQTLPLAEARKAQELSQSGHVRGKIVLNVAV